MRTFILRVGFLAAPLCAAAGLAWGCSSSDSTPGATPDAGDEIAVTPPPGLPPPPPPPAEAGPDPCANDTQADGLPQHLRCTGLYADFASKTLATGVVPYKPAQEFWSDGAAKSRFILIPAGTKIDISSFDNWVWPDGTTVWKQFVLDGKLTETRMFRKSKGSWNRTTYIWSDDGTEATRSAQGKIVPWNGGWDGGPGDGIDGGDGGPPSYEIPANGYCDQCHSDPTTPLLGLDAIQLGLSGATGVTLASLATDGRFATTPPATTLTIPDDPDLAGANAGKAVTALRWLNANCGSCHRENGEAVAVAARYRIKPSQLLPDAGIANAKGLDAYTTAVCKNASRFNPATGTQWVEISGQKTDLSYGFVLATSRAPEGTAPTTVTQMPPIITHRVDPAGKQILTDWINALPICP